MRNLTSLVVYAVLADLMTGLTYFFACSHIGIIGSGRDLRHDVLHQIVSNNVVLLELLCQQVGAGEYMPNHLIKPGLEQLASFFDARELM
jgi:hypothetical protein